MFIVNQMIIRSGVRIVTTVYVMLKPASPQILMMLHSAFHVLVTERWFSRVTVYAIVRNTFMLTKLVPLSTVFSVHLQIQMIQVTQPQRAWPGMRKNSVVVVTMPEASTKIQEFLLKQLVLSVIKA